MTTPATSAVTGKALSTRTVTAYAADWALFTDWCTATNSTPLPADWATVTSFTTGCPGAPATIRRRLAAIAHHHRTAGHPAPTDPTPEPAAPPREPIGPGQVDMLMRLLPSHGWVGGLFGRRDRALLTLAASTTIPYRQLPGLTVDQLRIADGVRTVHPGPVAPSPRRRGPTQEREGPAEKGRDGHLRQSSLMSRSKAHRRQDPRCAAVPADEPVGTDAVSPRATEPALYVPASSAGRHRPRPPQGAERRRGCR